MKRCAHCGIEQDEVNFYKNPVSKDGLDYYCKSCKKKLAVRYQNKNKEYHQDILKANRDLVESLKEPCRKCGEDRLYLIQFHHVDPKNKSFMLSGYSTRSPRAITKEASKCVCLCSNCHDEFHYIYGKQPKDPVAAILKYIS